MYKKIAKYFKMVVVVVVCNTNYKSNYNASYPAMGLGVTSRA